MGRILSGVAVLAVTLAAAPAARAATVASVGFRPARITAGGTVTASGRVANRGRRPATAIVHLRLRGAGRTRAVGVASVRVRSHGRRPFRIRAVLPSSLKPGRYHLAVCIAKGCRAASGSVLVLAAPPAPAPTTPFPAGARTGGDRLFPQIGNGGYDAQHYDLQFSYDAGAGSFTAQTTMQALATQDLGQLSMDLQGMTVDRVRVDGVDATWSREVPARASRNAEGIASKLVIDPPSGIPNGSAFAVTVDYHGVPDTVVDPDDSTEGWIPIRNGGAVVCQPIGCQSVFPQNNVPSDKATFDTTITVPAGMSAMGDGTLAGTSTSGGRTTWSWHMGQPISTYLTTATVGDYDFAQSHDAQGREIDDFVDRAITDRRTLDATLVRQPSIVDFVADRLGPYPFDSYGAMVADAGFVGYALEVATKPFYESTSEPATTYTHELTHQWFGDTITYRQIQDVWIHEGLASFFEVLWNHDANGKPTTTADSFARLYKRRPPSFWAIAPATPTAEQLFSAPVYYRGFMTYEGLREIVGDTTFFTILRTLLDRYRYGSVTTADVERVAQEVSGRDLRRFFQDYLYGTARPPLPPTYERPPKTRTSSSRSAITRGQIRDAR